MVVMSKIIDFASGNEIDPIDEELDSDLLEYSNSTAERVVSHISKDVGGYLCMKDNPNRRLSIDNLRYLIKRAVVEGARWMENKDL